MTYDGYGRLQTKHVPEQNASTSTTYSYNNDDTIYSVTDARGASATYGYNNNRHLVSSITYSAPAGVATTPNVSFGYDAAGNRTSMTDGLGSVGYNYNQLSRMTSETRYFSPLGQYFTLSYDYNLAGELKTVTDPSTTEVAQPVAAVAKVGWVKYIWRKIRTPIAKSAQPVPVREATDQYFGQKIADPYRWMEDSKSPEMVNWMKGQSDYTRANLDRLPMRQELLERITKLSDAGVAVARAQYRGNLYFYYRLAPGENDRNGRLQQSQEG